MDMAVLKIILLFSKVFVSSNTSLQGTRSGFAELQHLQRHQDLF